MTETRPPYIVPDAPAADHLGVPLADLRGGDTASAIAHALLDIAASLRELVAVLREEPTCRL